MSWPKVVFTTIQYQEYGLLLDWVPTIAVSGVLVSYITCYDSNLKGIMWFIILMHSHFSLITSLIFLPMTSDLHCIFLDWNGSSSMGDNVWGNQATFCNEACWTKWSQNILIYGSLILQIFPIHVKGAAGSLVVLVNWLGAWGVSYTYNFLMSWSSYSKILKLLTQAQHILIYMVLLNKFE